MNTQNKQLKTNKIKRKTTKQLKTTTHKNKQKQLNNL